MILRISYEEVTALNAAAERLLSSRSGGGVVAAPPELLAELESRLPLPGDISLETLAEQMRLSRALDVVQEHLKRRMDALVMEQYVGSDDAVNAYFDYAHLLTVRSRLRGIGREMELMIELMTGESPTQDVATDVTFPD